jgi:hypothetical protein
VIPLLAYVVLRGGWVLLYVVEAIAILSVLNRYPDDNKKADRTIRHMATLTKRLVPLKLGAIKKALYSVSAPSRNRATVAASAAPVAQRAAEAGGAPLAFRDGGADTLERIREELEAEAARGPRIPSGPGGPDEEDKPATKAKAQPTPRNPAALAERRRAAGLKPGQLDPAVLAPGGLSRREKELIDRKVGSSHADPLRGRAVGWARRSTVMAACAREIYFLPLLTLWVPSCPPTSL